MRKGLGFLPSRVGRPFMLWASAMILSFGVFYASDAHADELAADAASSTTMKQAFAAYRSGDVTGGDALAATLSDPVARITAEWIALRILQEKAGFDRINAFLASNPTWPTITLLRRRGEDALYLAQKDPQTILAFFKTAEPLTPTGRYLLGTALAATGKMKQAQDLLRRVWREDALPPDIEASILKGFGKIITASDRRTRIGAMLDAENWGSAERNAEREGASARAYAKAMTALAKKEIDTKTFRKRVPAGYRHDEITTLFVIQSLRRSDRLDEAAKQFLGLPKGKSFSKIESWWTERRVLARRLLDDKKFDQAIGILSEAYALPQTAKAEAAFLRGLIELTGRGKALVAVAEFDRSYKNAATDNARARAAFWRGLAHQAANAPNEGDFKQAASSHFGYYGFLARERLGQDELVLRRSPQADVTKALSSTTFQALVLLMATGERDAAVVLAGDAVTQLSDASSVAALSRLGRTYQDGRLLLQIGREAMKRGLPFDEEAFPVEGFPEPPQIGVERALVYGIARQESTFDPRAMSPVGARGLMQLMVATARETAKRNDLSFDEDRLLDDPSYNVLIGTTHLNELLETWSGSYILVIAAYNAGSANVRKWVEAYGDPRSGAIDPVQFVERIPFSETRNYVQRVLENVQIYRARLEGALKTQLTRDLAR